MGTVLVGGGPAASGLLMAAARSGTLDALLDDGLTVVDAGSAEHFGSGQLGGYLVRSDTRAAVFAECVASMPGGDALAERLLGQLGTDDPVPLGIAATLLATVARRLLAMLHAHPGAEVRSSTRVESLRPAGNGVTLRAAGRSPLQASRAILAVGGRPRIPPGLPSRGKLLLHSEHVLRQDGYRAVLARLAAGVPRVTIIGGSHSAFAVAGLLLRAPLGWAPGAITIAHRSPVLLTYPHRAAARADGVPVADDQVCPATGIVHRFGGLRADAAVLYRRVRDGDEPRIRLVPVPAGWAWSADVARDDPVTVAATGYGSAASGLLDGGDGRWDGAGRLRAATGDIVPHVYGLGLGTECRRDRGTGGEPAFTGTIDGVWFYQNVVAPGLLSRVLGAA